MFSRTSLLFVESLEDRTLLDAGLGLHVLPTMSHSDEHSSDVRPTPGTNQVASTQPTQAESPAATVQAHQSSTDDSAESDTEDSNARTVISATPPTHSTDDHENSDKEQGDSTEVNQPGHNPPTTGSQGPSPSTVNPGTVNPGTIATGPATAQSQAEGEQPTADPIVAPLVSSSPVAGPSEISDEHDSPALAGNGSDDKSVRTIAPPATVQGPSPQTVIAQTVANLPAGEATPGVAESMNVNRNSAGATIASLAGADSPNEFPTYSDEIPDQGNPLLADSATGIPEAQTSNLLAAIPSFEFLNMEGRLQDLLRQAEAVKENVTDFVFRAGLPNPWLIAMATAVVACELARRQVQKAGVPGLAEVGPQVPSSHWHLEEF